MSHPDLDRLREKIAAEKQKPKARKKPWEPVGIERMEHRRVLAFDQTTTNTGVAVVNVDWNGIKVEVGELIGPVESGSVGFTGNYDKALEMGKRIGQTMMLLSPGVDSVVFEMPVIHGHRTESILLAGLTVRQAIDVYGRGISWGMVSTRSMHSVIVPPDRRGDGFKSKQEVARALDELIPEESRAGLTRWNEHVRDAVGLALTYLTQEHLTKQEKKS